MKTRKPMEKKDVLLNAIENNSLLFAAAFMSDMDPAEEIQPGKTAMQVAYDLKRTYCMREMAKQNKANEKDTGKYGYALLNLVNDGDIDTAKILLEAGASTKWCFPNNGDRCLHRAIRLDNQPMLAMLLSFNFDLTYKNKDNLTAIQLAIKLDRTECFAIIIEQSKRDDIKGEGTCLNMLLRFINAGDIGTTRVLLEAGDSTKQHFLDSKDKGLHCAVRKNNPDMIALLLKFNFNVEAKNNNQETPEQLGNRLKTKNKLEISAYEKGQKIYHDAPEIRMLFIFFFQSMRQPESAFYLHATHPLNLIASFLYLQSSTEKQTVRSTHAAFIHRIPDRTARISATKLIEDFKNIPRIPSAESKDFIQKLTKDLRKKDCTRAHIYRRTTEFFKTGKGKHTRALVKKYKLDFFDCVRAMPKKTPVKSTLVTTLPKNKTPVKKALVLESPLKRKKM